MLRVPGLFRDRRESGAAFIVNERNEMWTEILAGSGFRTAGFVSAFVMSDRFAFAQGFEHYDENFDQLIPEGGIEYL